MFFFPGGASLLLLGCVLNPVPMAATGPTGPSASNQGAVMRLFHLHTQWVSWGFLGSFLTCKQPPPSTVAFLDHLGCLRPSPGWARSTPTYSCGSKPLLPRAGGSDMARHVSMADKGTLARVSLPESGPTTHGYGFGHS